MRKVIFLMAIAMIVTTTVVAQEREKKDVLTVEGQLKRHPDSIAVTLAGKTLSFFLAGKVLYMTDNTAMYGKFADWLPEQRTADKKIVVNLEGTFIDPFTMFTKEQLREVTAGLKKFGLDINTYKVARLFNYDWEDLTKTNFVATQREVLVNHTVLGNSSQNAIPVRQSRRQKE